MVSIKLKWNKLSYDDVSIDPSQGVAAFKQKVYELTSVPIDRQKLMAKGAWTGTLKDDADLSQLNIKDGQQVMLMGTAEVVEAPKEAVVFIEDMSSAQKAEQGVVVSAGLRNMGNTCYMNSTVQCIRHMPELREALQPLTAANAQGSGARFAAILKDLYRTLDTSGDPVYPVSFVNTLRLQFPQFAQTGQHGHFLQQDAEEFLNVLVQSLREGLSGIAADYDPLLGVTVEEEQVCTETDLETPVKRNERLTKVVCNITGGTTTDNVDHLHEGVTLGLEGTIEKHSPVLGRNALWRKKQRLASLPKYLCFQFMRFFWKATPESRDHTGVKCKILRAVTYPETLDVYELCCDDLQAKLRDNRTKEDKQIEEALAMKRAKLSEGSETASAEPVKEAAVAVADDAATAAAAAEMEVDDEDAEALKAAMAMSLGASAPETVFTSVPAVISPGSGVPADFTGMYELHSIVTHKGRSADSGHYIGWVRQAPGSDYWWKYDDDVVTESRTDEIMKLKGGGDRDMAYLTFYRFKETKKTA